jgi:hypothetical protein
MDERKSVFFNVSCGDRNMNEPGRSDDIGAISVPTEDVQWTGSKPPRNANGMYEITEVKAWSASKWGEEIGGPFKSVQAAQDAAGTRPSSSG